MVSMPSYPGHGASFGFACQTWIARTVNDYLHPGAYYCWFATTFNAMRNGDDSNPMWLFMTLDRAVAQGGVNNAKVKDVRTNIMRGAAKELRNQGRGSEIGSLLKAISNAPITEFTPQVWKIDLGAVAGRYSGGHQYPDEYLITDLKIAEFEVIII
ncbi:MAG: hypothetical protein ACFFBS_09565 [Promethearchaeota archaeon]